MFLLKCEAQKKKTNIIGAYWFLRIMRNENDV